MEQPEPRTLIGEESVPTQLSGDSQFQVSVGIQYLSCHVLVAWIYRIPPLVECNFNHMAGKTQWIMVSSLLLVKGFSCVTINNAHLWTMTSWLYCCFFIRSTISFCWFWQGTDLVSNLKSSVAVSGHVVDWRPGRLALCWFVGSQRRWSFFECDVFVSWTAVALYAQCWLRAVSV